MPHTHMFLAVVTDSRNLHLAVIDRIFQRLPAVNSSFRPAVRRMQEKEINIAQPAFLHTLFDALPHDVVGRVAR